MTRSRRLTATYRVQLNSAFRFDDACNIVPYLSRLGVSHLYASPILAARPGSSHGYDVVDPRLVNPELGGDPGRRRLSDALAAVDMGTLLDIVPNHMATGTSNPFWTDVLAYGRESPSAHWFDINWEAPGHLRGKVLLPILGDRIDHVLSHDELCIVLERNEFQLAYHDHRFPLASGSVGELVAHVDMAAAPHERDAQLRTFSTGPAGRARLRDLLNRQHYSLAHWRRASGEINYRRFFDVNELVALRVEDQDVFHATHDLILSWIAEGTVDGLRIDHVDGLLDPTQYLHRLRAAVHANCDTREVPLFVEKILARDEQLRMDWPVDGTTGYEFLNQLEAVFLDPEGADQVEAAYRDLTGVATDVAFAEIARQGKLYMLRRAFDTEVGRLAHMMKAIASRRGAAVLSGGTLTADAARRIVQRFIAVLPVYRTYIDGQPDSMTTTDRRTIRHAVAAATAIWPDSADGLSTLEAILEQASVDVKDSSRQQATPTELEFALRLQQLSGPASAKGVEDTALYRYAPLASMNEVGGEPGHDLESACARMHSANMHRAAEWPRGLLAVTTHDTKRSSDSRSRLDVLTEMPDIWIDSVLRWHRTHHAHLWKVHGRRTPDINTEYLLYQTLACIWPATASACDDVGPEARSDLARRVAAYMLKAVREAKVNTSWREPDDTFERALSSFVEMLVRSDAGSAFRIELQHLVDRIAAHGMWNSLSKVLIQLTSPGTPDLYQGDELWNLSLVDPDNRRAVDYQHRTRLLDDLDKGVNLDSGGVATFCRQLMADAADGRVKLHIVRSSLTARRRDADLFERGNYIPLHVIGAKREHIFAFARVLDGRAAVAIASRLTCRLAGTTVAPVGHEVWTDTQILLPADFAGWSLFDVLSEIRHTVSLDTSPAQDGCLLPVAEILHSLPVALLMRDAG